MRTPIIIIASATALIVSAPSAAAQARTGGLFGATRADTGSGNLFNVTFDLSEAYDSEVPGEFRTRIPQTGPQSGGFSTMLRTSLEYANIARRGQVNATGHTAFRYYQKISDVAAVSHSGALGARLNLSRTATVEVNQTAAYSPSYMYHLFPGIAPPELGESVTPAPEFRVDQTESYYYGTTVTAGVGSARANRVSVGAEYRHTNYNQSQAFARPDLATAAGRAKYARGFGRNGTLSAEYEYRTGDFYFGNADEHRLNIGAEYSKALAASRRATFRVEISPSIIDIPATTANAPATGRVQRLQGEGGVEYQLHRLWSAGGSYRRGLEYVPAFVAPVFTDSASARLTGIITRRIDVAASASLAKGESLLTRDDSGLDTYTGTARVRFALTRSFALYTEYLYYFYDLRGQTGLAPDLPSTFEQQGIRVGLLLWVPVF